MELLAHIGPEQGITWACYALIRADQALFQPVIFCLC